MSPWVPSLIRKCKGINQHGKGLSGKHLCYDKVLKWMHGERVQIGNKTRHEDNKLVRFVDLRSIVNKWILEETFFDENTSRVKQRCWRQCVIAVSKNEDWTMKQKFVYE